MFLWVFAHPFCLSFLFCEMQIEMASNCEDLTPIDVDSNGGEVAEVDNRDPKRAATTRTGVYKPCSSAGGIVKPQKHQRKLTSTM